jgi:PAS domain S-box-containing protein
LRRDAALLGVFMIYRKEVRPFADKQIALIKNFAAQAVIAMENARLLTETREALEQQTATAEVLGVINASPGDLQPVFEAILDKAHSLCGANIGWLMTFDGEFVRAEAMRGLTGLDPSLISDPFLPGPAMRQLIDGESYVQIPEISNDALEQTPLIWRASVSLLESGTYLIVPLRKDGTVRGFINAFRSPARLFSEQEIAVLQNFAAQAVIAMENARLITETQEALDQQTATAEVLQVINSSPGDLAPVFDAMLEKAMRLCEAAFGTLFTFDGEFYRIAAHRNIPSALLDVIGRAIPAQSAGGSLTAVANGESLIHIADIIDTEDYRSGVWSRRILADAGKARTALWVALRKDDALLGIFVVYRTQIRPFSDKQIALLQNFAAQAVIAMENARLLDEIRQRQAELRVTFDNMADGVVMFDETLHLAAWNKNFQEIVDLPDEFLASQHTYDDYIRYLALRGEFGAGADAEATLARYRGHAGEHYNFERTRPDGKVIEVRHNPMPEGGFVLMYSDITERKRSEEEIRAARDSAEAALRDLKAAQASLVQAEKMASLGQLTAGIAHEIKNPLNFVNNFASLSVELLDELKEGAEPALAALDENKRDELDETISMLTGNLEKIAEHGKRADNIVKSMLEHSRGVSGERRAVDLNALVEESLNLAYHGARAHDQNFNITLEHDLDRNLRPIDLVPQDMTRVFLNLFGNGFYAANKRAQQGSEASFRPVLHVATREAGDTVEVRVRDNGIGIPPDIRDKLFQPFFTTKPTGEGTGLGLSITYDIVTQLHGGTIAVDSEVGQFTEFTVRLPRHQQT